MKEILKQLKDLGVKELSVTKGEARAVNPYDLKTDLASLRHPDCNKNWHKFDNYAKSLPPLPTSGIPDGRIGIDEVEPFPQAKHLDTGEWFEIPNIDLYGDVIETRTALRRKTKEEIQPDVQYRDITVEDSEWIDIDRDDENYQAIMLDDKHVSRHKPEGQWPNETLIEFLISEYEAIKALTGKSEAEVLKHLAKKFHVTKINCEKH